MAYCTKCGSSLVGDFCSNCGNPAEGTAGKLKLEATPPPPIPKPALRSQPLIWIMAGLVLQCYKSEANSRAL